MTRNPVAPKTMLGNGLLFSIPFLLILAVAPVTLAATTTTSSKPTEVTLGSWCMESLGLSWDNFNSTCVVESTTHVPFPGVDIPKRETLRIGANGSVENSGGTTDSGFPNRENITNYGTILIENTGESNIGVYNYGGAIYNYGAIMIENSGFFSSGIYNAGIGVIINTDIGTITIANSGGPYNSEGDPGANFGIDNEAYAVMNSGTIVVENLNPKTIGIEGAIANSGNITIRNTGTSSFGISLDLAAIYNSGTITIKNAGGDSSGIYIGSDNLMSPGSPSYIYNTGVIRVENSGPNNTGINNGWDIVRYEGTIINACAGILMFSGNGTIIGTMQTYVLQSTTSTVYLIEQGNCTATSTTTSSISTSSKVTSALTSSLSSKISVSSAGTPSTTNSSSTSISGIPEFPFQALLMMALVFIVALAYFAVRRSST